MKKLIVVFALCLCAGRLDAIPYNARVCDNQAATAAFCKKDNNSTTCQNGYCKTNYVYNAGTSAACVCDPPCAAGAQWQLVPGDSAHCWCLDQDYCAPVYNQGTGTWEQCSLQ